MEQYSHEMEGDGVKDHEVEVDTDSLGVRLKKHRRLG